MTRLDYVRNLKMHRAACRDAYAARRVSCLNSNSAYSLDPVLRSRKCRTVVLAVLMCSLVGIVTAGCGERDTRCSGFTASELRLLKKCGYALEAFQSAESMFRYAQVSGHVWKCTVEKPSNLVVEVTGDSGLLTRIHCHVGANESAYILWALRLGRAGLGASLGHLELTDATKLKQSEAKKKENAYITASGDEPPNGKVWYVINRDRFHDEGADAWRYTGSVCSLLMSDNAVGAFGDTYRADEYYLAHAIASTEFWRKCPVGDCHGGQACRA